MSILGPKKEKSWSLQEAEREATSIKWWVVLVSVVFHWFAVLAFFLFSRGESSAQAKRNFSTSWQLVLILTILGFIISLLLR